ncbi:MAG: sulfotransferase, partial [Flavobacteriales bacterium]|nr:sulfotransferase [Flavobacteriales bacterium]
MKKQLFIVGAGRSGTTLLQSILDSHSEVSFSPESHFFRNYIVPQLLSKSTSTISSAQDLVDLLNKDEGFKRLDIDAKELAWGIDFSSTNFFTDVFDKMNETYLRKSGKMHFGDKDPMNLNYLKLLKMAFPEAYVIHIVRDPRDVVMSRMKTSWGKKYPFFAHVFDYAFFVRKALNDGPGLFKERYLEVRYEDLVRSPDLIVESMCKSIGISYEPSMLSFYENEHDLVKEDEKEWKGNVVKPIME